MHGTMSLKNYCVHVTPFLVPYSGPMYFTLLFHLILYIRDYHSSVLVF